MNRGVLMTPFHNMALMSPATTEADVDRHTEVFGGGGRGAVRVGRIGAGDRVASPPARGRRCGSGHGACRGGRGRRAPGRATPAAGEAPASATASTWGKPSASGSSASGLLDDRASAGAGVHLPGGRLRRERVRGVVLLLPPGEHLDGGRHDLGSPVPFPGLIVPLARWRRPSTATIAPLPRYWAQMSARRSQAITAWYSAFSQPFPMYSFVATDIVVTCLPDASARISGSRVSRPVKRTLFIGPFPSWPARSSGRGLSRGRRVVAGGGRSASGAGATAGGEP